MPSGTFIESNRCFISTASWEGSESFVSSAGGSLAGSKTLVLVSDSGQCVIAVGNFVGRSAAGPSPDGNVSQSGDFSTDPTA